MRISCYFLILPSLYLHPILSSYDSSNIFSMIISLNKSAIIVGTIIGIMTGLAAYKINTSGKYNESFIIKPVDLTLTATENIKRICQAASIGQAEIQPGRIIVTQHYNTLDGQNVRVEATLSYDDSLTQPCKLASIT